MKVRILGIIFLQLLIACNEEKETTIIRPQLQVAPDHRHLEYRSGDPFFWLGGTSWGMSEWLNREDVDFYLDNRKAKGFTLVQICLFWGKRTDDPVNFRANQPNAYGYKAFLEKDGIPDPTQPAIVEGGTPDAPNDYWDHVTYIVEAAAKRDMMIALLPVWGRRYVNASHPSFSAPLFSESSMYDYGRFLGGLLSGYDNIIWVLGGDVKADMQGDYLGHYRAMAEGIVQGITGEMVAWNEASPLWDRALMTYHPDGTPMKNSSTWFHRDAWLDFNMIETFRHRDQIVAAVHQDYVLDNPIKPTVMGEPAYEDYMDTARPTAGIHMRRQAWQSFFAGAAGFTYGGGRDEEGHGPLFSPFTGWKELLDREGARSMQYVKTFCQEHYWPYWIPAQDIIKDAGSGELQQMAVWSAPAGLLMIYFPDNVVARLDISGYFSDQESWHMQWYNPSDGHYMELSTISGVDKTSWEVIPPKGWSDAVFLISR
ncbi:MAG: DUF4038 domain-containing protein [Saprospiraceae bacterium]|nr:DUF4038 domain-containing protein [Lewinella sp.]